MTEENIRKIKALGQNVHHAVDQATDKVIVEIKKQKSKYQLFEITMSTLPIAPNFTCSSVQVKTTVTDAVKIIENSIVQLERQVQLEIDAKATTEENIRKIKARTNIVHLAINQAQDKVIDEMKKLNGKEQEEVVKFWSSASEFFTKIVEWIWSSILKVLQKIYEGITYVVGKVKEVFAGVWSAIKSIF